MYMHARTTVPNSNSLPLHFALATERACALGMLTDLNFLDSLMEVITWFQFIHHDKLLGMFVHLSPGPELKGADKESF